ncbi:hypothetical protein ACDZ28_10795 [Paenibacillus sp. RS8]|uniref:hypothetical protein n=1 Tax=Paenibacillus sp. RS8 TaxID=3242681 RepID=UPI0035BF63CB
MHVIFSLLALFGLGWLFLITLVGILGGLVKVELRDPFTNKNEVITNIDISRKR